MITVFESIFENSYGEKVLTTRAVDWVKQTFHSVIIKNPDSKEAETLQENEIHLKDFDSFSIDLLIDQGFEIFNYKDGVKSVIPREKYELLVASLKEYCQELSHPGIFFPLFFTSFEKKSNAKHFPLNKSWYREFFGHLAGKPLPEGLDVELELDMEKIEFYFNTIINKIHLEDEHIPGIKAGYIALQKMINLFKAHTPDYDIDYLARNNTHFSCLIVGVDVEEFIVKEPNFRYITGDVLAAQASRIVEDYADFKENVRDLYRLATYSEVINKELSKKKYLNLIGELDKSKAYKYLNKFSKDINCNSYVYTYYLDFPNICQIIDNKSPSNHDVGMAFEDYVAKLYSSLGYMVSKTPASGDFGIDLVIKSGCESTAMQLKHYDGSVGVDAVMQAFSGAKYYDCKQAAVLCTSEFTDAAYDMAEKLGVELRVIKYPANNK